METENWTKALNSNDYPLFINDSKISKFLHVSIQGKCGVKKT